LVQETLGICARFHYCLRLAPSTTTDNHLPQQQTNKKTTRAFLPSFSHTFFCFCDQPEEAPALECEREIRDTTEESAETENKLLHRHRKRSTNLFSLCVRHPATTTTGNHKY
jgi:hypothetical protein